LAPTCLFFSYLPFIRPQSQRLNSWTYSLHQDLIDSPRCCSHSQTKPETAQHLRVASISFGIDQPLSVPPSHLFSPLLSLSLPPIVLYLVRNQFGNNSKHPPQSSTASTLTRETVRTSGSNWSTRGNSTIGYLVACAARYALLASFGQFNPQQLSTTLLESLSNLGAFSIYLDAYCFQECGI
jgi:hypothetical protein